MIIGFTGRKGSGKDTAAKMLIEGGFAHIKFAGALKEMLANLMYIQGADPDTIHRSIEGDLKETPSPYLAGRTPRHAMQTIGTQWGRDLIADDLWIQVFKNAAGQHPHVVVSDVRFPNEVEAIRSLGGVVYRVERPGVDRSDEHPSETLIDTLDVDGTLVNDLCCPTHFQQYVYDQLSRPRSAAIQ